jgi:prefoldin subunit 5
MNDKQRLREIEEVLTVILQEQERLKAEMHWLRAERNRAEERIARLERAVQAQQQGSYPFISFDANANLLQTERLLLLLMQPQTQN